MYIKGYVVRTIALERTCISVITYQRGNRDEVFYHSIFPILDFPEREISACSQVMVFSILLLSTRTL